MGGGLNFWSRHRITELGHHGLSKQSSHDPLNYVRRMSVVTPIALELEPEGVESASADTWIR